MKIAIACDHGALDLKLAVKAHLLEKGYEVADFGTDTLDSCDYPDYVAPAAKAAPVTASTGFKGQVVSMSTGTKQEVVLFRPTSFNDTSKAADDLRSRKAVVLNLENVDKAMSRRVVDFLSGCVYALDGSVKKVAQSAYIFCPHNMDVVGDLEAIQAEIESY